MGEYTSKKRTQSREQLHNLTPSSEMTSGIPNSMLNDVFAGKRRATSEMMGRREELAPSIAAKMSQAFGMNLNGMQVYRSDAMSGSGMQGMASGNKVVLSSDVDLNTMQGQAILGHEISHIHAQSQGIGMGNSGLLQNAALEHQADAEGMMAARGMSISGESMGMSMGLGMAGVENLTPLSGGMGASAGAPMQAKKPDKDAITQDDINADMPGDRMFTNYEFDQNNLEPLYLTGSDKANQEIVNYAKICRPKDATQKTITRGGVSKINAILGDGYKKMEEQRMARLLGAYGQYVRSGTRLKNRKANEADRKKAGNVHRNYHILDEVRDFTDYLDTMNAENEKKRAELEQQ